LEKTGFRFCISAITASVKSGDNNLAEFKVATKSNPWSIVKSLLLSNTVFVPTIARGDLVAIAVNQQKYSLV
jgi:hypothetical protein